MASWLEKLLNQQIDDLDDEEAENGSASSFTLDRNLRVILAIIVTIFSAFFMWWIMA